MAPLEGTFTVILSDRDIKKAVAAGRLIVEPYVEHAVQPVSIDLTLGNKLRVFREHRYNLIDVKQRLDDLTEVVTIDQLNPFFLHPDAFVLGITVEWIGLPGDLMGRLDGKSSLGRLGLLVHSTAGFIDPGFKGCIVLEFTNVSPMPITLYAGMPIAQVSFYQLSSPAEAPYGHSSRESKYQHQREPTPSRYYLNFENSRRSAARGSRSRTHTPQSTTLKEWLTRSEFRGNVREFARALGAPPKTVEDWVYGRAAPGSKYRALLLKLTELQEFSSAQQTLLSSDNDSSK